MLRNTFTIVLVAGSRVKHNRKVSGLLTDIYFIRHGAPDRTTSIPYQSMPGPDLTDGGRDESRQAARFLADREVEHIFASPFARAVQTAEQIVTHIDLPITFASLITEQAYTESVNQVRMRVQEFLNGINDSSFKRVAIVSHGSPIKQMLLALTDEQVDLSAYRDAQDNPLPTAAIWHAHRQDGIWQAALVFRPTDKAE